MTTELSSAKYLPAELTEGFYNDAQESDVTGQSIADPSQAYASSGYQQPTRKASTGLVTFFACFLALAGIIGIFSGVFGAIGQAAITSVDSSQISSQGTHQQAEIIRRTLENQKKFSIVVYLHSGIRVLVGLGFVASCIVLFTRRRDADSFATTAFTAAIFYNIMTIAVTWATMPSLEGLPGIPEGTATMASAIGIGFMAIGILFKIGFYGFAIAYFSRPSVKAIFNPEPSIA